MISIQSDAILKLFCSKQGNGDRAFKIKTSDDCYEVIQLSKRPVDGLITLNTGKKRDNVRIDKYFLKGLLIGVCTLNGIKDNESTTLGVGKYKFIKGNV